MNIASGLKGVFGRLGAAVLIALAFSLGATSARAGIVLGGGSAVSGTEVMLRVSGPTDLFFSADLAVRYDPGFLSFVRVAAADFALSAMANPGLPNPLVDVLLTVTPDTVGPGLNYFDLVFMTIGSGGLTTVELLAGGFFAFQDPADPLAPELVENLGSNIGASVRVLPGTVGSVPISSTLGLALSGLALLGLLRRGVRLTRPGSATV